LSQRVFRSPSSSTAAAATTSLLYKEAEGRARWRELPDRAVEVATLDKRGQLERLRVEPDGATSPLAPPTPPKRRWAGPTAIVGLVLFLGTAIFIGIQDADGQGEHPLGMIIILSGFALLAAGMILHSGARDIDSRVKRLYGKNASWYEPTNLNGWQPRSSAQLRAVEELADAHEGVALVRDVGGRTIEAYAGTSNRFEHYWVDVNGNADLLDRTAVGGGPRLVDRVLRLVAGLFFFGGVSVGFLSKEHKGLLLAIAFGGFALACVAGALNDRRVSLERYVSRLPGADGKWHEIRTWIEEDDGG